MTIKTFLTQNKSANLWIFALVNSTFNTSENIKTQKKIFKAPLKRQRNKKILWKELLEDNQMIFKNTLCMQQHHSHCRFCSCDSDLAYTVNLSPLHMNVSLLLQWCLLKFIRSRQRTFQSALQECGCFHLKPMHICYAAVLGKNLKYKNINVSLISSHQFAHSGRRLEQPELFPGLVSWLNRAIGGNTCSETWPQPTAEVLQKVTKDSDREWEGKRWDSLLKRLCIEGPQRIRKSRFEQKSWNVIVVYMVILYFHIIFFNIFLVFCKSIKNEKKKHSKPLHWGYYGTFTQVLPLYILAPFTADLICHKEPSHHCRLT